MTEEKQLQVLTAFFYGRWKCRILFRGKDLPIDSENFKLQSLIDAQLNAPSRERVARRAIPSPAG